MEYMAYGIYYERYEDMSLNKYQKFMINLALRQDCEMLESVYTRKLIYQKPQEKKMEDSLEYQIIMKNGDTKHMHLVARRKQDGAICKKSVWLLKEDCERILNGEIDWIKEENNVALYDFYYYLKEGYQPYAGKSAYVIPNFNFQKLMETDPTTYENREEAYCKKELNKIAILDKDLQTIQNCRANQLPVVDCISRLQGQY